MVVVTGLTLVLGFVGVGPSFYGAEDSFDWTLCVSRLVVGIGKKAAVVEVKGLHFWK